MGESDLIQGRQNKNLFCSGIAWGVAGGAFIALAQTVGNLLCAWRERRHARPAAGPFSGRPAPAGGTRPAQAVTVLA
jgi:hypothetical protein